VLLSICLDPARPLVDLRRLASRAEEAAFARVFLPDHFMPHHPTRSVPGPVLECWTALTALSAATSTIGLGTLVLGNSYRHPAVVANMAATLDHVSGGRLLLGLGAGWQPNEHQAYGLELLPTRPRLDRFEEALRVVTLLLGTNPSTFDGDHYQLTDAWCEPTPIQQPLPILVGGAGERRSIPLAARYAHAWHAWATPEQFVLKNLVVDEACRAIGRAPAEVRRLTGQVVKISAGTAPAVNDGDIVGDSDHVVERLWDYAAAGVDEFVVRDHRETPIVEAVESVERLGSAVVPRLNARPDLRRGRG